MPKTYTYNLELKDDPNTWIVYKEETGDPTTRIGYLIDLNHYEEGAHRCSCEFGIHQRWQNGIPMKECKHIQYVLDHKSKQLTK